MGPGAIGDSANNVLPTWPGMTIDTASREDARPSTYDLLPGNQYFPIILPHCVLSNEQIALPEAELAALVNTLVYSDTPLQISPDQYNRPECRERLDAAIVRDIGFETFEKYLEHLATSWVTYRGVTEGSDYRSLEQVVMEYSPLDFGARSAASYSDRLQQGADFLGMGRYARYYADVYGSNISPYIPQGNEIMRFAHTNITLEQFLPLTRIPIGILRGYRISDLVPSFSFLSGASEVYIYGEGTRSHAIFFDDKAHDSLEITKNYKDDLDNAGGILHDWHPDIVPLDVARLMHYHKMFFELYFASQEDQWQNAGACHLVGCEYEEEFNLAAAQSESGYDVFGIHFDSNLAWQVGSEVGVDVGSQGLGMMQLIPDLVMVAASNPDALSHLEGYLTAEDFQDRDATISTILDDKKQIYALTLTLGYIIDKLEEHYYADDRLRLCSDDYPFITDPDTARQMSIVDSAFWALSFPEQSIESGMVPAIKASEYLPTLYIVGDMFGIRPDFAHVKLKESVIPGTIYSDNEIVRVPHVSPDDTLPVRYVILGR